MRNYAIAALLPLSLAVAPLAFGGAMAAQQSSASSAQPLPPAQIDDATLIKFDRATLALRNVRAKYGPKYKSATNDNERAQIKQQGKKAADVAVSQYMPVSQYMQVAKQVREDPALKQRAIKLAQAHVEGSNPPSSSGPISDATLIKFDRATLALRNVRAEFGPKYKSATTDAEKAQLKQQEKKTASAAVTQYMPVSDYRQVMKRVRHDPEIKARAKSLAAQHKTQMQPQAAATH